MGDRRGAYRVLVGKPEGKRPLARAGRRWEDNIKVDQEGGGGMDGIDVAQDRALVKAVMNLWVSQNVGNFLTTSSSEPVNFPRKALLRGASKEAKFHSKLKLWALNYGARNNAIRLTFYGVVYDDAVSK
jgi:hypothetical protein